MHIANLAVGLHIVNHEFPCQNTIYDPSSATAATRRGDCNRDGPPPFAEEVRRDWIAATFCGHILADAAPSLRSVGQSYPCFASQHLRLFFFVVNSTDAQSGSGINEAHTPDDGHHDNRGHGENKQV